MERTNTRRPGRTALVAALVGGGLLGGAAPATAAGSTASAAVSEATVGKPATLGPFGFGGVRLGMSAKQARATKKIVRRSGYSPCTGWDLKAYPAGRDNVGMLISDRRGVAIIYAPKGVRTPQGIKIGSTAGQMIKAYPRLKQSNSGYATVTVPGNPKATYRFLLSHGEIYQVALALKNQDCAN
ncbi:hypothetical protein [Planobispora takensis]|uniref:Uncharacterized protein n=1 Tax=Planobispora takensis TaxID=1367882 RepID=A0A8J3SX36_9ACTN|nr:hypothetical protein [Planobispora takensis]GII00391.1 hypothetical protein Pta02_23990 [Planobispora takensis]